MTTDHHHLRVLIANEREDRIALVTTLVAALGHTVIAGSTNVVEVGALTASEHPDVALVGLGTSSAHALELIERIVREADCPVIAVLEGHDPTFVDEAAKRGVFAYIVDGAPEELQSALDITLRRFAEYHNLQGAFGRRAQTERAKGILMERYQIDERQAFEMLRDHARHSGQKLVHVAQAVLDGHLLLPAKPGTPSAAARGPRAAVPARRPLASGRKRSALDSDLPARAPGRHIATPASGGAGRALRGETRRIGEVWDGEAWQIAPWRSGQHERPPGQSARALPALQQPVDLRPCKPTAAITASSSIVTARSAGTATGS